MRLVFVFALSILSFDLHARNIECHAGQKIRVIETRYPAQEGDIACSVIYHKPSEGIASKTLWKARNDVEYCDEKARWLANKLENASWVCNSTDKAAAHHEIIQSSLKVSDHTSADVPSSPLEFRKFLEQHFAVDFETKADYYYGEDQEDCIATACKRFFDYRSLVANELQSFFGYKVSDDITLWMDLECRDSHCWGQLYKEQEQEQEKIKKLSLPEFETDGSFSIFLKSQHQGFPDLWLPISHNSSKIVEVKLLRYYNGSYQTLAHLLAKPDPDMKVDSEHTAASEPGIVTLKANFGDESLELIYKARDIKHEGLLLNPRE